MKFWLTRIVLSVGALVASFGVVFVTLIVLVRSNILRQGNPYASNQAPASVIWVLFGTALICIWNKRAVTLKAKALIWTACSFVGFLLIYYFHESALIPAGASIVMASAALKRTRQEQSTRDNQEAQIQ